MSTNGTAPKSAFDMYNIRVLTEKNNLWETLVTGVVDPYSDLAKTHRLKNEVIVSDAITGHLFAFPVDNPTYRFEEVDFFEMVEFTDKAYEVAKTHSDSLKGLVEGKLFSIGVADGYAHYEVVKVNQKSVHVEWRGYCPDRWVDTVLGYGGSFPRKNIERIVHRNEALHKLFSAK